MAEPTSSLPDETARAIVEAIFADLRGRRLLKWLFTEEPESHGAIGYVDGPIDRETQDEIAATWAQLASDILAGVAAR